MLLAIATSHRPPTVGAAAGAAGAAACDTQHGMAVGEGETTAAILGAALTWLLGLLCGGVCHGEGVATGDVSSQGLVHYAWHPRTVLFSNLLLSEYSLVRPHTVSCSHACEFPDESRSLHVRKFSRHDILAVVSFMTVSSVLHAWSCCRRYSSMHCGSLT